LFKLLGNKKHYIILLHWSLIQYYSIYFPSTKLQHFNGRLKCLNHILRVPIPFHIWVHEKYSIFELKSTEKVKKLLIVQYAHYLFSVFDQNFEVFFLIKLNELIREYIPQIFQKLVSLFALHVIQYNLKSFLVFFLLFHQE